jgi:transcriptional regulator with XRE-family HTH domain
VRDESCGSRVTRRRRALGLTQTELADLCSLTQQTISKIENNSIVPRDKVKFLLADKMLCSVDSLFPWPKRNAS